jgi:hypothetical protein
MLYMMRDKGNRSTELVRRVHGKAYLLIPPGVVDIDQYVDTLLPGFSVRNPYGASRKITFRQLASHLSGLPR